MHVKKFFSDRLAPEIDAYQFGRVEKVDNQLKENSAFFSG